MTEIAVTAYTFSPSAGTVTFTAMTVVDAARVVSIYDTSLPGDIEGTAEFGTVLYIGGPHPTCTTSGNVVSLPKDAIPPQAKSTDTLKISYNVDPPDGWQTLTYANVAAFPATGVPETLYLAANTGQLYQWSGAAFVAV
jgi:hypothetical protein